MLGFPSRKRHVVTDDDAALHNLESCIAFREQVIKEQYKIIEDAEFIIQCKEKEICQFAHALKAYKERKP